MKVLKMARVCEGVGYRTVEEDVYYRICSQKLQSTTGRQMCRVSVVAGVMCRTQKAAVNEGQ